MKKAWSIPAVFILSVAVALFVVSCTYEGDTVINLKGSEEESTNFISESLAVIAPGEKESGSMSVRFYEGDSYIPYVPLQYFFEQYMKYSVVSASYANDEYRYTIKDTANGNKRYYVVVNSKKDTVTIPAFSGLLGSGGGGAEDSSATKMFSIITKVSGENTRVFDLAKYGFKVYGSYDDVFVPLCILSNVFSAVQYARYFYNGKAVYQTTSNDETYYDSSKGYVSFYESDWFKDSAGNLKERPKALIDYSYNLLRFTHDYLYGKPGYYGFADDGNGYPDEAIVAAANKLDFDQMMIQYAGDVRTLLLSSSYTDYTAGLTALFLMVYGDSHSGISAKQDFITDEEIVKKYGINFLCSTKMLKRNDSKKKLPVWRKTTRSAKTRGASYTPLTENNSVPTFEVIDNNKTAIIRFDGFEFDMNGWRTYYSGTPSANPDPATVTIPDDTIGIFYKAFYALEHESDYKDSVKNVVVDLSCNGGGSIGALYFVLNYLLNPQEASMLEYDVISGSKKTLTVSCDLNLDGVIDSNDKKKDYNFAVYTSLISFSCGNAMPCICSDKGIKIIGQKSGGGSCVIRYACTADGFPYQYSDCSRISHSDWSDVEGGAAISEGGEIPAGENMYDDDVLIGVMNNLFGE